MLVGQFALGHVHDVDAVTARLLARPRVSATGVFAPAGCSPRPAHPAGRAQFFVLYPCAGRPDRLPEIRLH